MLAAQHSKAAPLSRVSNKAMEAQRVAMTHARLHEQRRAQRHDHFVKARVPRQDG